MCSKITYDYDYGLQYPYDTQFSFVGLQALGRRMAQKPLACTPLPMIYELTFMIHDSQFTIYDLR